MRALPNDLRKQLETAVIAGRRAAEAGVRAAFASLGVQDRDKPPHLNADQSRLRRGLKAKQRQLGGGYDVLVWDAAYEQWHRLLFARFLAENDLLRHPEFGAPVTLAECEDLAEELGEPDGWSVAARFAAEILPGIFRLSDPCVQLRLAPEHRIALEGIIAGMPAAIFAADDSLGWVYQYWQSERKDQVNASEVKIGGAELGPVTQLFTENYMVRCLLENSLGAWWAARHPESPLVKQFEYLRLDGDRQPAAGRFEGWPDRIADVTVMDPCCGSGHFLVEAFGMLWRMRAEEEGFDPVAAQDAVLRDNLFGLELDPRCVQIAMFAVALTAWKQGDGWRKLPTPNIACSGIPAKAPLVEWTALADGDERLQRALERLHRLFEDAETLGSLIAPRRAAESASGDGPQHSFDDVGYHEVAPLLEKAATRETDDPTSAVLGADAAGIARAANLLSRSYTLSVTNVPYLGSGRMTPGLAAFLERWYSHSRKDLATAMLERWQGKSGGTLAIVTPETLLFLRSFEDLRRHLLKRQRWNLVAALGPGAFRAISGEVVQPLLLMLSASEGSPDDKIATIDVRAVAGVDAKDGELRTKPLVHVSVAEQLARPGTKIALSELDSSSPPLQRFATATEGLSTGDNPRFLRFFWELPAINPPWRPLQNAPDVDAPWEGRAEIVRWFGAHGVQEAGAEARIQGHAAWTRAGVLVGRMSTIRSAIYDGGLFNKTCVAVVPTDEKHLIPLFAYVTSDEFERNVRALDKKVGVATATLIQVPFDVERWERTAKATFPHGLPEAQSDNPTQWLFHGHPDTEHASLQVAVARLVGYRWPEQAVSDDADKLADADGITCLAAVGGEQPAANRLQALLVRAYGAKWSPGLLRQLLEQTGSKKRDLAEWLRDDFFGHHCGVFSHRPFVWHIWDGRKDGFAALVNYHRLDRAGLEKLTYTYLGHWIERQRSDAADDVAGADLRLAAAQELKGKLEAILEGKPPYDIYVRWKALHEQPIGWEPDLNDGVRLNIRPFVMAGVLRSRVNVNWNKDRGKNADGSERLNDLHLTIAEKQQARHKARRS
jgi:hypothetical protein